MALAPILQRVVIQPGTYLSPGIDLPTPIVDTWVRLRLNVLNADWDDPAMKISFGIERSLDAGATWDPWVSGTTQGGARSQKDNSLPTIAVKLEAGQSVRVRATLASSHRLRLGVDYETEPA